MSRHTPGRIAHVAALNGMTPPPHRHATSPIPITLVLALTAMLALLPGTSQPATGQINLGEPVTPEPEPTLTLDTEALLGREQVLAERIDTAPWVIEANIGRRLVALPLLVTPLDETTELGTSPSIGVRGGRLLVWIIETEEDAGPRHGRTMRRQPRAGGWGEFDNPAGGQTSGARLPEGTPRVARRVTVEPDGRMAWRLERSVPNGILSESDEPYVLRIRPDRLRALQPERPRMEARGNADRATLARQRREAEREFMRQQRAFVEMQRQVMVLPDEFELAEAVRVWAVFEVSENARELTITGETEPLPWTIGFNELAALRAFAGTGGRRMDARDSVPQLMRLANDSHPLTHRLLAQALIDANVIRQVEPNDTMYNLIQQLLRSDDIATRQAMLAELVALNPPSTASMMLLRIAAEQNDPTMKLLALRGLLQADPRDADRLSQMLDSASELLIDRDGPEPAMVLAELIEAIGANGQVLGTAGSGIAFERMPRERREPAIGHVVSAAGESPLAAAWLDRQLLGSDNPNVVQETLEHLVHADAEAPEAEERDPATDGPSATSGTPEEKEPDPAAVTLARRIPVTSARHSLFRSLNSGHEQIRQLAWQALHNFRFEEAGRATARQRQGGYPAPGLEGQAGVGDHYDALVDAALGQAETPPQAVAFLRQQANGQRAGMSLARLVIEADDTASHQAGQALLGSGWPMGEVLQSLSEADRVQFADRLYDRLTGELPRVTGLLREASRGRGGVNDWFGQRLAEGQLPAPREWAEAYRNEDELIQLAGNPDASIATAAVAALVYAAGGDDIAVNEQIDHFRQLQNAPRSELRAAWSSARRDIYARRLTEAQGSYRLVLLVRDRAAAAEERRARAAASRNPQQHARPESPVQQRITLGVVDLIADGRSIRLSNDIVPLVVPDEQLAIRIERASSLSNFNHEALADLSLDDVRQPLDLLPESDEAWAGRASLRDGRQMELRMEPVE